jgi:hypothetical protein
VLQPQHGLARELGVRHDLELAGRDLAAQLGRAFHRRSGRDAGAGLVGPRVAGVLDVDEAALDPVLEGGPPQDGFFFSWPR